MFPKIHIALGIPVLVAMLLAVPAVKYVANAEPLQAASDAKCAAPKDLARLDHGLRRTMNRIAAGLPLTIVAIGSSSTAGAGASDPQYSYPARLAANLQQMLPGHEIKVINRGINGQEAGDMLARLDKDVLAEKPDLVLWQFGTNGAIHGDDIQQIAEAADAGLKQLKASGADVVIMDLQYVPAVVERSAHGRMLDVIEVLAKQHNVNVFRRFAVMRHWREAASIPFATFVSPDGLHLNDWSYGCVASILAGSLVEAASRPVMTAGGFSL